MFHYPVKKSDLLVGNQEGYFKVNAALAEFQTYIAKLCEELHQYSNETLQEYGIERIEAFRYRIEKSGYTL